MENISLSKDKISTIEAENTNYASNFDTLTNKSPIDFKQVKSAKYSGSYGHSFDRNQADVSFQFSPPKTKHNISTLRNENRWTNSTMSPKKLNFHKKKDSKSVNNAYDINEQKRNKFNIKEVIYSNVSDTYQKPTKSVMQILKENNDDQVLKQEMALFENFEFPNNMRLTSNLLEMHPQIMKDKLRISKFVHKYFNPRLYLKNNIKTVKTIMKLDKTSSESGYEGSVNLYEPFNKIPNLTHGMKEIKVKKRNGKSVKEK